MLCDSVDILSVDFFCGEMHIHHGGLNLAMPHELHQSRQADAVAQHVPSEGVTAMLHEA
jgi:cysteinyl-tRNA synthetase